MPDATFSKSSDPPSDAARRDILVDAGLFVLDPSSFPNLSPSLDPGVGLDPEFRPVAYDTRDTTGEMVKCSICRQQQAHFDGAIVGLRNNKFGLVGNNCGKRHFFGEDGWTALQNRMRADADRAVFMARFGSAVEAIDTVRSLLTQWADDLRRVDDFRQVFQSRLPTLFRGITRRTTGDGALTVDEVVQVPFKERDGSIEYRREIHVRTVCKLSAQWFFEGEQLHPKLMKICDKLCDAKVLLRPDANAHNIDAVQRMIRRYRKDLEDVAKAQEELKWLGASSTVSAFAQWGNDGLRSKGVYSASGSELTLMVSGKAKELLDFKMCPAQLPEWWELVKGNWPRL